MAFVSQSPAAQVALEKTKRIQELLKINEQYLQDKNKSELIQIILKLRNDLVRYETLSLRSNNVHRLNVSQSQLPSLSPSPQHTPSPPPPASAPAPSPSNFGLPTEKNLMKDEMNVGRNNNYSNYNNNNNGDEAIINVALSRQFSHRRSRSRIRTLQDTQLLEQHGRSHSRTSSISSVQSGILFEERHKKYITSPPGTPGLSPRQSINEMNGNNNVLTLNPQDSAMQKHFEDFFVRKKPLVAPPSNSHRSVTNKVHQSITVCKYWFRIAFRNAMPILSQTKSRSVLEYTKSNHHNYDTNNNNSNNSNNNGFKKELNDTVCQLIRDYSRFEYLQSHILTETENDILMKFLIQMHNEEMAMSSVHRFLSVENSIRVNLLYRASRDGFDCKMFHLLCDNKGPTLCVIRSEDNHVFGGYTSVSWSSSNMGHHCDPYAFIFALRLGEKASLKYYSTPQIFKVRSDQINGAVFHSPICGPTFGYGRDIVIKDAANTSKRSWSNFPASYSVFMSKDRSDYLCGAQKFKVLNYEVYSVQVS